MGATEKSAILIPFMEVDDIVDTWRMMLDPARARGIPGHVTVLFPFLHPTGLSLDVERVLREYFVTIPPFDVTFNSTEWFDDRVVYLEPTPPQPFRAMTHELQKEFPSCVPYEGKYAEAIPHLTLGDGAPLEDLRQAEALVRGYLPIRTQAQHAWLMTGGTEPESWSVHQSFPLGN